jgi:hypothetical protein
MHIQSGIGDKRLRATILGSEVVKVDGMSIPGDKCCEIRRRIDYLRDNKESPDGHPIPASSNGVLRTPSLASRRAGDSL